MSKKDRQSQSPDGGTSPPGTIGTKSADGRYRAIAPHPGKDLGPRGRLCRLLRLTDPTDEQLYADAESLILELQRETR